MSAPTLSDVELSTPPGGTPNLRGLLGVPAGQGPWPGVVMVHEAFGIDDVMRRQVQRMAAAGYVTLMPDLFTAGGARRCLVSTFRALSAGEGRAFVDVEAARAQLLALAECTGRVGVLGFCIGGAFALQLAAHGYDASAPNYGRLPSDLDTALTGACPVVASYGGRDRSLRGAAGKLEATLTRLGVEHDVKEYPTASHAFFNDAPVGPKVLHPVFNKVLGIAPDPAAAADAWRRIEAFFAEHLGARAAGSPSDR